MKQILFIALCFGVCVVSGCARLSSDAEGWKKEANYWREMNDHSMGEWNYWFEKYEIQQEQLKELLDSGLTTMEAKLMERR